MVTGLKYQQRKRDANLWHHFHPFHHHHPQSWFLFIIVLLLFYKFSGGNSDLEWYTGSGVWQMWGGLCWTSRRSDPCLTPMKYSKGGRVIHMDMYKGGNGGNIQAMGTSHYFIVRQVALLGVSDHCVKKKQMYALSPWIYIFQSPMDWIPHPALDS